MNNDYKWETVGRCKFYTDGTTCTDIEVMDDTDCISFIYPEFKIDREKCKKVFPSIKNLMIGRNVISIMIPNRMFPNVKQVESKSNNFVNGKYLIEKTRMILLNAFEQNENAAIDFTLFNRIEGYAFEGCRAKNAIGLDKMRLAMIKDTAFIDSGFLDQPFINGIKCIGPLVIDIDETADEIVLPKEEVKYFPPKQVKCIRVTNLDCVSVIREMPTKIILDDKNIRCDDILLKNFSGHDIEAIESRISRYKTIDGIVYSSDMKTLIMCPAGKTGTVIIPDGVMRIRKQAFDGSKISKVIFPDSLTKIQDEAFFGCKNLKEIDFGHGIEQIGGDGSRYIFSGCPVEKLVFPPQVKEIGLYAFFTCCELKEVIFNEGLEYIRHGAFKNCPQLTEINIPTSIKKIEMNAFVCEINRKRIQDININLTTIPEDFGHAVIHHGRIQTPTPRCVNVHIDNQDGIFDFVLPDCVSAVSDEYHEIIRAFNLMADNSYNEKTWYNRKILALKHLKTAFLYASNSYLKCVDAYKTYKRTQNEVAKEYLIDYQKRSAEAIAVELTEKDFVDFMKLEFIHLGYDEDILNRLREQNWNIALAYMLDAGKKRNKEALEI